MSKITIDLDKLKAIQNEALKRSRMTAFKAELDPLSMKCVRGEATKDQLIQMAADIRARFPYLV